MGAIYSGLVSSNSYLFITNDIFGTADGENAIVRVNKFCGALIVTAKGNFLVRVCKILNGCLSELNDVKEGLSVDLSRTIIETFEKQFQKDPGFKENPLPFLLLLIGYNLKHPDRLEHIFLRNRVVQIVEKDEKREYLTEFDIQPPVPAKNLFYGHSELSQYLLQLLPASDLNLEAAKLSACLSMLETQKIDNSLYPSIRMATLSADNGFEWIKPEELQRLSEMEMILNTKLTEGLYGYFVSYENSLGIPK